MENGMIKMPDRKVTSSLSGDRLLIAELRRYYWNKRIIRIPLPDKRNSLKLWRKKVEKTMTTSKLYWYWLCYLGIGLRSENNCLNLLFHFLRNFQNIPPEFVNFEEAPGPRATYGFQLLSLLGWFSLSSHSSTCMVSVYTTSTQTWNLDLFRGSSLLKMHYTFF